MPLLDIARSGPRSILRERRLGDLDKEFRTPIVGARARSASRRSHGAHRDRRRGTRGREGGGDAARRGVGRRRHDRHRGGASALPAAPLSKGYLAGLGRSRTRSSSIRPSGTPSTTSTCAPAPRRPRSIPPRHRVTTTGGDLPYDALLLATGASPRRLPIDGHDLDGVHSLRTLDDSDTLAEQLRGGGRRLVLIGSGWIGMEVAATARGLGNDVTILERDPVPLAPAVGARMGEVFRRLHEEHGVELRTSVQVSGSRAATASKESWSTARPCRPISCSSEWAPSRTPRSPKQPGSRSTTASSPMHRCARAHRMSGRPATSPMPITPSSSAACAASTGRTRSKPDRWRRGSMMGRPAVHDKIPYFYTDQFDLGMELSGYPPLMAGAELIVRGDLEPGSSSRSGSTGRAGGRRDERQCVGRAGRDPEPDPKRRAGGCRGPGGCRDAAGESHPLNRPYPGAVS